MTDKERELLARNWQGMKCVVCQFEIDQIELNEVTETEAGYAHNHCLKSEEEKVSEINNEKLLKKVWNLPKTLTFHLKAGLF